jgi:hypothetical protein
LDTPDELLAGILDNAVPVWKMKINLGGKQIIFAHELH